MLKVLVPRFWYCQYLGAHWSVLVYSGAALGGVLECLLLSMNYINFGPRIGAGC